MSRQWFLTSQLKQSITILVWVFSSMTCNYQEFEGATTRGSLYHINCTQLHLFILIKVFNSGAYLVVYMHMEIERKHCSFTIDKLYSPCDLFNLSEACILLKYKCEKKISSCKRNSNS